jgi:pimeloyl-ACP methyl ester carboxylesterase
MNPVGTIWGERDHVAVPLLDRRIAALNSVRPEAVAQVIPKAGRWVVFGATDLFNAAPTRLLSDGL